jgi:hypothetical protein
MSPDDFLDPGRDARRQTYALERPGWLNKELCAVTNKTGQLNGTVAVETARCVIFRFDDICAISFSSDDGNKNNFHFDMTSIGLMLWPAARARGRRRRFPDWAVHEK